MRVLRLLPAVAAFVAAAALPAAAGTADGTTERVSVASNGDQGRGISGRFTAPAVSDDGRVVAFDAEAENLDPDDGNGENDVFVHDRPTGQTELVSVNDNGTPGNDDSDSPSLDANGRFVAFASEADNLVPEDLNQTNDVFVRDRLEGDTELISQNSAGRPGNASSGAPDITPTGRYVAFASTASNLVRDDENQTTDIFVRDRLEGTNERVNVASDGTEANLFSSGPSISDSGRYVAFTSFANTLVPGDDNGNTDVFWHDRVTGETVLVSVSSDEQQGNSGSFTAALSGDGRYVAFHSGASNLVPDDTNETQDVFVRDVVTGTTERVSVNSHEEQANGQSGFSQHGSTSAPDISDDGRYVTFDSFATNLVPGDTNEAIDAFRRDRLQGTTMRVSVTDRETQADGSSSDTAVDASGDVIAFISQATNLVRGDTNRCGFFSEFGECPDVFVRDLRPLDARW